MPSKAELYAKRRDYHRDQFEKALLDHDIQAALLSFKKSVFNNRMIVQGSSIEPRSPKQLFEIANGPGTYVEFFREANEFIEKKVFQGSKQNQKRFFRK